MRAGITGILASIKAFSESDHSEDLKRIDVPTLILHGDDDQIVPIAASALVSATLVKGSILRVYPGSSMACTRSTRIRSTRTCWPSLSQRGRRQIRPRNR
jgi:non-heme chloroperoxidase